MVRASTGDEIGGARGERPIDGTAGSRVLNSGCCSCYGAGCLGPGVGRGVIFVRTAPMTIEIPTTGERFTGRLTEEPAGPLCLTGRSNRPCYVLSRVLSIGWRIVECTPDERRLMGTHGITLDRLDLTGAPQAASMSRCARAKA
jgi:hypothetical protein